jgi:hypothetical protein
MPSSSLPLPLKCCAFTGSTKCEPPEVSTPTPSYRDHVDSNSDVEDFSQSVSAWRGLRLARGHSSATPGPSTPTQQRLPTPVPRRGEREFATAPPPDSPRRYETLGRQRAVSVQPEASVDIDPELIAALG